MMRKEPYAMNHRPRSTCAANAVAVAMGGCGLAVAVAAECVLCSKDGTVIILEKKMQQLVQSLYLVGDACSS